MARVRTPVSSMVLEAVSSCLLTLDNTSPNLPNSVLTAASICHTSLERCSMARVRKPMRKLLKVADRVVGPATTTLCAC